MSRPSTSAAAGRAGSPAPSPLQLYTTLAAYADALDALPLDLTRSFSDLRELDAVLGSHLAGLTARLAQLSAAVRDARVEPGERLLALKECAEEARAYKMGGEDKIRVAVNTAETIISHSNYITSLLSTLQAQPTLAPFLAAPPSHIAGHLSDGTPIGLAPPTPAAKPKKGQPPRMAARPTASAAGGSGSGGAAGSTSASGSSSAAAAPAAASTPPSKATPTPKKRKADAEPSASSSSASRPPKKKAAAAPAASTQSSSGSKVVRGTPLPEEPRRLVPVSAPSPAEAPPAPAAPAPRARVTRAVRTDDMDESEGDERRYCWCDNVSYGDMIGCDGDDCEREWFHLGCVGMLKPPQGTWYCADCVSKRAARGKSKKPTTSKAKGTAPARAVAGGRK